MKKILPFLFLLFIYVSLQAQKGNIISGTITSIETGQPLENVTITEKGTTNIVLSNTTGNYSISLTKENSALVFSYVGYGNKELRAGSATVLDIVLELSKTNLDEVVVTAFGIKKEKKSLGYTVQQVTGKDLNLNRQSNVVNALQGKVAGVTVSSSGGGPGQGASILIRGINSIDAGRNNQPLFIVDGVEIDNNTFTTGGSETRGMSNRAADINPDDIESVSVLRGGAATALYGIRASNGAIIITTKSARAGKLQLNYTGSYGFENINKTPEVQNKFSQGFLGVYDKTSFWPSWGPTVEVAKTLDPTHPDKLFNNFKQAYRAGNQARHSVNLTGGTDKVQMGASFSYFNHNGVIPFSDYRSYNARVNGQFNISSKIKAGASLNFINSGGGRVNADRYGEQLIYWSPRWDVMDYLKPDGTQNTYSSGTNNPVYTIANNRFRDNVNRIIGSANLSYTPFSWLNFTYRFGNDYYVDSRTHTAPGPKGVVGEVMNVEDNGFGFVAEHRLNNRTLTATFMANIMHTIKDDISLDIKLGHDLREYKLRRVSTTGDTLVVPDLFLLQNAKRILASNYIEDYRNYGLFADVTIGWKNFLFLNLTGRNDFTSTLAPDNRSYFYPSASLSYVFSDQFNMPSWWDYGKLKISYAKLGKDGNPYGITTGYVSTTPIGNTLPWTLVDRLGNPGLRPEFTQTYEVGTELRFLKNRLGVEIVGYLSNSKDLLVPAKVSTATGFEDAFVNAGEIQNKGIEITLSAVPIQNKNFSWDARINFSTNKNEVVQLNEGLSEILIASHFGYLSSSANMKLIPGYAYGALFGRSYKRYYGNKPEDPILIDKDQPLLIGANGFPVIETKQKFLGNTQPKWMANTLQTLHYKQFSLSVLLDVREGQYKYNQFANFMSAFGVAKITENRTESIVFKGVLADGTPNAKVVYLGQGIGPDNLNYGNGFYRDIHRGVTENFIEDASWFRLRSVTLAYNIPQRLLSRTKVINGATVSVTGNNLWLSTKYSGFDPESSSFSTGNNASEGFAGFTYPGVRSFLFTVNLQF